MEWYAFPLEDIGDWLAYYDRIETRGPYHDPRYLEVLTGYFEHEHDAELFVLERGDEFVYYPFLKRRLDTAPFAEETDFPVSEYQDIVSSWYYGGPLLSSENAADLAGEFPDEFREYCRRNDVVSEFVRFDPNVENHEAFDALEPTFNRETVWVDLTQSKDALWDGFEKRNRNAIRQGQETEIEVEPTTEAGDYEAFYDIYTDAMEAKDATMHYRFPFTFFEELLGTDLASLLVARYEGEVIGGSMVVHDGTTAHDYLRASEPDYWDMRVNNLLCYGAMMEMRDRGHEVFDFQGGRPGVFKFKRSFSPDRGKFYIAKRVHDCEAYEELVDAAAATGIETDTDYFPAYRVERSN